MAMRTFLRGLFFLVAGTALTACGGGGGNGGTFQPPAETPPSQRIEIQATRTQIPANVAGVAPFVGSPYISELQVTFLKSNGSLVPNGTTINFNVSPVEIGAMSTLDDPETADVNEFTQLLGSGTEDTNSGQVTVFFHSFDKPGTATIRFSFDDADTGNTISKTVQIKVVESGSTGLPNSITFNRSSQPLYVQGSGGSSSSQFEVIVEDGAGEPVPDPQDFNNVVLELVDQGPDLGASLSGTNAGGNPVSGRKIRLATTNGRASATLNAGSQTGAQTVRVTADRADNNVSNDLNDPISNEFSIAIGDGKLFSLTLTSPDTNAIEVNRVDSTVALPEGTSIPPDPDGTYSLTISALGTDRQGNPVLQGTELQFGLISGPLVGFPGSGSGGFPLSGTDGDPDEGRVNFNAPTGAFTSAGGGAGPGDTLVLFGKDVQGNSDLEGARTVASIQNDANLRVNNRFNLNDTTGQMVDNGPVIPYVIGRATTGSIDAHAFTDENGVATVQMHYPVSRLGQAAVVWTQGNGAENAQGDIETVGDVAGLVFPGLAPAMFAATPETLPPNTTTDVLLCLVDAASSPIQGVFIHFVVTDSQGATVTVDGQSGSGTVQPATGGDGCTIATVTSSGQSPSSDNIPIVFSVGALSDTVEIVPPGNAALFAIPSLFIGDGNKEILLRLVDAGGDPIPGVQIGATCMSGDNGGTAAVVDNPGTTNQNGETTAVVRASVDGIGGGSAQCRFFTVPDNENSVEATVEFMGIDLCNFSPPPAGCSGGGG